MKLVTMAAVSALVLMASGTAAQEVAPAPHASHVLDLDSADAAISQWGARDLSGLDAAHGVVTIIRLGKDKTWPPTFSIKLEAGEESAWLRFRSPDRKTVQAEALYDDGKSDTQVRVGEDVPLEQPFEVDIDWTDRLVTFSVNVKGQPIQRFETPLASRPTRFSVSAATGEFKIDPLVLGTRR
jgi:hypothetical protein